jgi:hypothetical protein
MNIELFKQTTREDYERRLKNVLQSISEYENNELFKRIMNYDRQMLYSCMGNVLDISQTSVLQNRDELTFLESVTGFISYYMQDDGEVCIRYQKYNINNGEFDICDIEDKGARPYLDFATDDDEIAREEEVLWLLDTVENNHKLQHERLSKHFTKIQKEKKEKEFIDYNI